jgi:ATP-dependent RNA helicase DDX52/ROK1
VHGAASLPPIDFFTDHSPESVTDGSCVIADENEAFTFNDDGSDFENQTEVANFRKKHRIKVVGEKSPDPLKGFNHLRAKYSLNRAAELYLKLSGFSCLTSIQKQAIPVIMEERDLIACAPTGTGTCSLMVFSRFISKRKNTGICNTGYSKNS